MDSKRWNGLTPLTVLLALTMAAFVGVLSPGFGHADDDDERVKTGDLPKAIRQALRGVEIEDVEKESSDGGTIYEITIEVAEDSELELVLDEDGRLLGVEVEEQDDDDGDKDDKG